METFTFEDNLSRLLLRCEVKQRRQTLLIDTGSPNTMITLRLAKQLGLKAISPQIHEVSIAGGLVRCVATVLPELSIGDITIHKIRVLAGLNSPLWRKHILLGLNVLNYFRYTIDRSINPGTVNLGINDRPAPHGASRSKFDHLITTQIVNGKKIRRFDTTPDSMLASEITVEEALLQL